MKKLLFAGYTPRPSYPVLLSVKGYFLLIYYVTKVYFATIVQQQQKLMQQDVLEFRVLWYCKIYTLASENLSCISFG